MEPRHWRKALKSNVQQHLGVVTAPLRLLDDLDGDFDLKDAGDLEPSLGVPAIFINGAFETDIELDNLHLREGDGLDWGEANPGEQDSGEPIEGGGSGPP